MTDSHSERQAPTFKTERLHVWKIEATPISESRNVRDLYVASIFSEDWPGIICCCSVWSSWNNWVDWIETAEGQRRRGIARELIIGIEQHLDATLLLSGTTELGMYFTNAMRPEAEDAE